MGRFRFVNAFFTFVISFEDVALHLVKLHLGNCNSVFKLLLPRRSATFRVYLKYWT